VAWVPRFTDGLFKPQASKTGREGRPGASTLRAGGWANDYGEFALDGWARSQLSVNLGDLSPQDLFVQLGELAADRRWPIPQALQCILETHHNSVG
jgi:hypothetical protein